MEINKELIIDLSYDFDKIQYIPIRYHRQTGFVKLTYANIEIRWPMNNEIKLIWEWFKRKTVYRAFGYSQPPRLNHIENSRLPDLTTKERHLEPVEFLMVRDGSKNKSIGFCVVYEARSKGDPNQELDFTIADDEYLGNVVMIRVIEICILSYLFAVRGAKSVFWIRRKRLNNLNIEPQTSSYTKKGPPTVITRLKFKQRLKRVIERKVPGAYPVLSLSK